MHVFAKTPGSEPAIEGAKGSPFQGKNETNRGFIIFRIYYGTDLIVASG